MLLKQHIVSIPPLDHLHLNWKHYTFSHIFLSYLTSLFFLSFFNITLSVIFKKLQSHCYIHHLDEELGNYQNVGSIARRRANTATQQAQIWSAMNLLWVRKIPPANMTVLCLAGKSTWKRCDLCSWNKKQQGTVCFPCSKARDKLCIITVCSICAP